MSSRSHQQAVRCAVYTRQSVDRDLAFSSCDAQREVCEAYVASMSSEGWSLVDARFDDVGESGGTLDRPAFRRLLAVIADGHVDAVVVHRLDRLTRSVIDWAHLDEALDKLGVRLVVVAGEHGAMDPVVRGLMNNILAAFGEFERALIGERLRDARAAKRARGLRSAGRVPFGYIADARTRQLIPHPTEAAVVREFFRQAALGESGATIARWANKRGIRTKATKKSRGKPWSGQTVLQLLRSPLYLGMRATDSGLVPGAHDALVDEATVRAAREAIAARRTREPSRPGATRSAAEDPFILRGLLACGGCGGGMTTSASVAVTAENAHEVPRYYRCRGVAERPACKPGVQVSASEVEARVLHHLLHPERVEGASRVAVQVLEALVPVWPTLAREETAETARLLVRRATWEPRTRSIALDLNEPGLKRFADEYAEELGLLDPW